ncbi:RELT-like protein 1 [Rhinoraja longicauda]
MEATESWLFPDSLASQTLNEDHNQTNTNSGHSVSIAFVVVPIFILTGLLGLLICHVLTKKGYRCTTDRESVCEELVPETEIELHDNECNADTIGQMVHYIMKNPANAEALHAMVDNNKESANGPPSPLTPESPDTPSSPTGSPTKNNFHHLHTVGGAAGKSSCSRCNHRRSRSVKEFRKSRPGEVTVLSVGRFRVTHVDPKARSSNQKELLPVPPEGANMVNTTHLDDCEVPSSPTKLNEKEETEAFQKVV